jgi:Restriction endonuclease
MNDWNDQNQGLMKSLEESLELIKIRNKVMSAKPITLEDFIDTFFRLFEAKENGISLDFFFEVLDTLSLKVFIQGQPYEPSTSGLRTMLDRRIQERKFSRDFESANSSYPAFHESDQYSFIRQFVSRYRGERPAEELDKLRRLLNAKGWSFDEGALSYFLVEEFIAQRRNAFRSRVKFDDPTTFTDYLFAYLHSHSNDNVEQLKELALLLEEDGLGSFDIGELRERLIGLESEVELEHFERQLSSSVEPISIDDVDDLEGFEFESFLSELYSKMGYNVEQTKLSGDQGADLLVARFGEKTVIQAKRYTGAVGNYAVQEIVAARSLYQAHACAVITNSYFTPAAIELADANGVLLIDRDDLEDLIRNIGE